MTSLECRFISGIKRTLIFVMCVSVAICIIIYRIQDMENKKFALPVPAILFSIYTNGCKINYLDPFDDTIRHYIYSLSKPLICPQRYTDIVYQQDNWLRFNWTSLRTFKKFTYCKYAAIHRINDTYYRYTPEKKPFNEDIQIDDEFIKVTCFSDSHDNIYQNLFAFVLKNYTKEESRKKLFKEYIKTEKPLETLNVVMIGVDSMSRSNFIRQMPKSISYLKTDLGAIDFHGFNKVGDGTFRNIVPMLSGKSVKDLPWSEKDREKTFDKHSLLWKFFSTAGYATMFAEDLPSGAIFNYLKAGFHKQPTDYYLRTFYLALEKESHRTKTHCIGNKQDTEWVLDYLWAGLQTFKKSETPHFSFAFITNLSHDYINDASLGDDLYESFLKKYKSEGHYNNTMLLIFGDHGMRYGGIRLTTVGKFEERLPGLYVVVPPWFHQRYPMLSGNLHMNSRRLVTSFDVHETLKNVLGFNGSIKKTNLTKPGISLFSEIMDTRTCADAGIPEHDCFCYAMTILPVFDNKVISATIDTLHWINKLTNEHRNICAEFELADIIKAEAFTIHDIKLYQIKFNVTPSEAIFESTIKNPSGKWRLMGDVSRINRYGNQSDCINKMSLKKFCFCVVSS